MKSRRDDTVTKYERELRAAGYGPQSYAKQIWHVIKYAMRQRAGAAQAFHVKRRTHRHDEQNKY